MIEIIKRGKKVFAATCGAPAYYSNSSDETEKREANLAMKVIGICNDEFGMDKKSH